MTHRIEIILIEICTLPNSLMSTGTKTEEGQLRRGQQPRRQATPWAWPSRFKNLQKQTLKNPLCRRWDLNPHALAGNGF
jgi:hypothetical protein